ncbi:hypothetical protein Tco_1468223 [Tanacetum coccineum]
MTIGKGIRAYKFNLDYVANIKWVVGIPFNARVLYSTSVSFSRLVNLLEVKRFISTSVKEIDIVQLGIFSQAGLKFLLRSSSVSAPPHKLKAQELNPIVNIESSDFLSLNTRFLTCKFHEMAFVDFVVGSDLGSGFERPRQTDSDTSILVYRKACLDSLREYVVHCKELPGFKYRHDMVKDVLFDVCRRAGISAKKEAHANFLTDPLDGRSTLRLADVLIFRWVGGKHACVDLNGISPLVGLSSRGFTVGHAALKAASCKVTKHKKTCIEN